MKILGIIIAASLILCVARVLLVAVIFIFVGSLLWGVFFRPAETFGLLIFCAATSYLQHNPAAGVVITAMLILIVFRIRHDAAEPSGGIDLDSSGPDH